MIITDHFRGIYRTYPNLIKENRRPNSQALGLNLVQLSDPGDFWAE